MSRGAGPRVLGLALVLVAAAPACEGEPVCVEDPRAQVLDERVEVTLAEHVVPAELADEAVERERGWKHRACDRQALLLLPDAPGPVPVWGCGLTAAIDAVFVADGEIVAIERIEPCPEPCGACPSVGAELEVDGVVELELGIAEPLAVGDPASW